MSIVCGTDFSEMAAHAGTVAASLAARLGTPLHLVHALEVWPEELHQKPGHPLLLWAESRLATEAERLRALGAEVIAHALPGPADEVVLATAREVSARFVVVGAIGQRKNRSRGLGSRAGRAAQHAHVPVLAVRESAPFLAWLKEERTLRIVLGVDASQSAENAARWLADLCRIGPCELILAHLYWPPEVHQRLGLGGLRSFVEPDPTIVKTLESQLSKEFDPLLYAKIRSYRIEPHLGRVGDGLAGLAAEAHADLLVVGCHDQSPLDRLWEGSVAGQALGASNTSVACVPTPTRARTQQTPRLQTVVAATDFSEIGNGAIALAYAAACDGGTVHLVHVVKAARGTLDAYDVFEAAGSDALPEASKGAEARLTALVPLDGSGKSVSTRAHVLEAEQPALAICQAAERLGADLICVGTHGRTGLAKATLGSVALGVLAHTRRPVLVAHSAKP
jgi:nucleotide-binding universal stress UspA family protein